MANWLLPHRIVARTTAHLEGLRDLGGLRTRRAMVSHSEYAYVIDATGRTRDVLDTDPGPATEATKASFAVMLADTIKTVLAKR